MNKKNTKYLLKKYPDLYRQYKLPMAETAMCWGFDCGNGWFKLIDELSKKIVKLDKTVEAVQVKEKFGGLRFYINPTKKEVHRLVQEYEDKSYKICEVCGNKGKLRGATWFLTLCDKHYKHE